MIALYVLAISALLVGTAAVYMALLKPFPVQWLYYHYFIRKPAVWTILAGSLVYVTFLSLERGTFPLAACRALGADRFGGLSHLSNAPGIGFPCGRFPGDLR